MHNRENVTMQERTKFTAGEAGEAIGVDANTLRQWRTRKYCLLGSQGERGYWLYREVDVHYIAVARALNRLGFSMDEAVELVTNHSVVNDSIHRAMMIDDSDERLICVLGSGRHGEWYGQIVTAKDAESAGAQGDRWAAFDALEAMGGGQAEFFTEASWEISVTRIVRRVRTTLDRIAERAS
ncbi:MerR family transcriptional regulator [Nitratireductor sp. StC3]|uniref:MerR family transcriptional regulator n=1 Tax=Nitratireductor sp. StC3 TaxID=2126741 RepID=UPI000D0D75DB|nr:MerR family transcriptional regulator [Nitratireductor sp. StC3]PSM20215.1 hypothetical protein C7T96_03990 [Nitratireductor sp. StC3]